MKRVAVIGASTNRAKFGNKAVRAFRQAGYDVVPITPSHDSVEGLKAFGSVLDVPGTIDMATVYLPPAIGALVLDDIAKKGITDVWFNPGAWDAALIANARALGIRPTQGCSIIGIGLSPSQF